MKLRKPKNYLFGRVDALGRLVMDEPGAFARALAALRGREVQVLIEPKKKRRSDRQNAYYWGVIIEILSDHTGYSPEEMHEALKSKFLGFYDKKTGLRVVTSSAEQDTVEFENYMSQIRAWASENDIFIPLPNEQIY